MPPTELDQLDVLAGVAAWARPHLALADVPIFGSPEWLALAPGDARRDAATARAALAWWRCGDPVEDVEERADAAAEKAASAAISAAEDWSDLAYRPSLAELRRLRDWGARAERDQAA